MLTEMEQEPTGKVAFDQVRLVSFARGVKVPPQVLVAPGVAATFMLAGSVSVKLPSTATTFGFVIARVRVVVPLTGMGEVPKLFTIRNGSSTTMLAVTVA